MSKGKESKLEIWMKASAAVRRVLYIPKPTEQDVKKANMLVHRYTRLYKEPFVLYEMPKKTPDEGFDNPLTE